MNKDLTIIYRCDRTINDVVELTQTTYPPAQKLVTSFVELGILEQKENKQRGKSFKFRGYLDILEKNLNQ